MKIKNKNIFICALLLVLVLFCVSTVSAEDALDDKLASDDAGDVISASGDTIYVDSSSSGDEQGTQSNPYKTISAAVGNATGGETIFIKNGNYSESVRIELPANKPLNFIGESNGGVKITATSNNGLFYSIENGNALLFKNLTFSDIRSGNYAPLYLGGNSLINITDCSFNDCGGKWGSIYVYTSDVATIDNCNIINSKATAGSGAAAIGIAGSGTTNIKDTLIEGTEYIGSSGYSLGVVATTTATAIANLNNVTISNSNIIGNGIIFTRSKMTVTGSKIIDNALNPLTSGYQGDSIIFVGANSNYKGDLTIEQSIISNNTCTVGAVLKTNAAAAKLTMNYNNIQENSFNTTYTTGSGTLDLEKNYWGSNTLPGGVDATVWVVEEVGVYKFNNGNEIDKEIPGINDGETPEPTVHDTIYVDSVNGLDTNDGLTEATAVKTIEKGVELASDLSYNLNDGDICKIIVKEGTYVENAITIEDSVIFLTTGPVTWDANGKRTLYVKDGAEVSLSNITFINGNETYNGAVIRQEYGVVTIDNCVFTNNGGENKQALIQNKNGNLTIINSVFDKNTAHKTSPSYGNIYLSQGNLYVENCNFTNNYNKYGVFYITQSQAEIYNSSFIGNNATSSSGGSGAGIFVGGTSTTKSTSSGKITEGIASNLIVKNCEFINNTAFGGKSYGGSGGAVYVNNNATVKIEDSLFKNNVAISDGETGKGGAIFASAGDIKLTGCVFENNAAEEGAEFYLKYYAGTSSSPMVSPEEVNILDIKNSIFYDENEGIIVSDNSNYTVDINENYWSSNDNPASKVSENINIENWVIMDAKISPDEAQVGDNITIDVAFDKLQHADGTVSEYAGTLPSEIIVTFTSTSGKLNETVTTKNGKASVNYTIDADDDAIVIGDVTVPLVAGIIYVSPEGNDTNAGTESKPVATIAHAIDIASKGKIVLLNGTYKTGDLGSISKDLTIISQGEAIIDAQNNNRVLYVGTGVNVLLQGITLTNGYTSADESGALLGNSGNLTLINCTLTDSKSGRNGGAIYNAAYLTVIGCTFENNEAAQNGGAIFTQSAGTGLTPTLTVTDSNFTKNSAGGNGNFGGGAIFAQQAADGLSISNSNFMENNVLKSGGGAIEIVNVNVATISGCNFVFNSAKGEDSESNYGGGAISFVGAYSDKKETLTITDSLFEENTVEGLGGGAIYARASTVDVSSSILVDNDDDSDYAVYARITSYVTPSVTVNDNWWGSSDSPKDQVSNKVTLNRWAVLSVSNDTAFVEGKNVTITADINSYTTGTTSGKMSKPINVGRAVTIETSAGDIDGVLENGEFSTVFNVPAGLKYVDAIVDYQKENLYIETTGTTVQVENISAKKAERPMYVINVTSSDGTIINQGTVELFINEESVGILDVINGTAKGKFVVSLAAGTYDILAKYTDEDGLFDESFGTATLTVSSTRNDYIYNSNFHDYFDEAGYLYDDIPYTNLYFRDNFNAEELGLDTITIAAPMHFNIYSSYGQFDNITFRVTASDVLINRIVLNIDGDKGAAFKIDADDVTLQTVTINYNTVKDTDAYAVYAYDVDNFRLLSSTVNFNSNSIGTPEYTQHAVQFRDCTNSAVTKSKINSKLPACDVDYDTPGVSGIDKDLVLAIGIQGGENNKITTSTINTEVVGTYGNFPTVDSIMADSVINLEISKNTMVQTDFSNAGAGYSNVVDLYTCNNAKVVSNDILVNSTAGEDGHGSAYPVQLTGPYTGVLIDGNSLTSISKGPTLGIYSQNYYGATDLNITNNVINVTGLATNTSNWALVSGMELQDTVANIYGNTIYAQSTGAYDDTNYLFGISYAQWDEAYGGYDHTYDIRDNEIFVDGKYAVYFPYAKDSNVIGNNLHAHELWGNDAATILDGKDNVIRNNYPPYSAEVFIEAPNAFKGYEYTITVTITNATDGYVVLKVNNKEFKDLHVVNGTVSQVVDFADLVEGEINNVTAFYGGSETVNPGKANATFIIVDGVITNSTFFNYFDAKGYLLPVPENAVLDFQGPFIGATYKVFINQPVNIISSVPNNNLLGANDPSTATALFYTGATGTLVTFNVVAGADYTNVTGLTFVNAPIYVTGATHVTFDDVYVLANRSGVGSGTGFVCYRAGSEYGTFKNSYLENAGNGGSSVIVAAKGASYLTVDNNTIMITGGSGNIISANNNAGGGSGASSVGLRVTNNYIDNKMPASGFCYAIALIGSGNLVENNTIKHNGTGITSAYGETAQNNIYRNNIVTGTASFAVVQGSIADGNTVQGPMSISANSVVTNNVVGGLNINGANIVAENNTITGAVTLGTTAKNTTFADNTVEGLVTVKADGNVITGNTITSTSDYAIDLTTTSNNIVTDNKLSSANKLGDNAVKYDVTKNNTVVRNGGNPIITIDADNVFVGNNNTIAISVVNATGNVTVKVNNKEFKEVKLVDGAITIKVNASDIVTGENIVIVTYNGDEYLNVGTENTTFIGLGNVVTEDIFYNYFDDYGFLRNEVPFDELIFKGKFNKLSYYIYLDRPINITGQDALLNDIAIIIDTDDVTIDGLTMVCKMELGDLISVMDDDVTIKNMNITYIVGDMAAYAINVHEGDNANILDNVIYFESGITSDKKEKSTAAIYVEGSSDVVIDGNDITARLPGLYMTEYDLKYYGMGLAYVNGVKLYECEDIDFTNNVLDVTYSELKTTSYPDIQALAVMGSKNVLIEGNSFIMNDTLDDADVSACIVGIQFSGNDDVVLSDNDFSIFSNGGQPSGAGTAYPIVVIGTSMDIIGNDIFTEFNGPNLGIYMPYGMAAAKDINVSENNIHVIGNVSAVRDDHWALVSGIEAQTGKVNIYNNSIETYNKAEFKDDYDVYGVSFVQNIYSGTADSLIDVQNNTIITNGNFTVRMIHGIETNVTGNTLYAHELFGDDSVKFNTAEVSGIIENNYPPFEDVEVIVEGQTAWIGTNSTITVTVPNGLGNVTIKIGTKTYKEVPLVNGTVTVDVAAEDLVFGTNEINVTYNGDKYILPTQGNGTLQVVDGVITNETFKYYFDMDDGNYLFDYVPENAVLDFQGLFIGAEYSVYINKGVNVVSTTGDAVFDSGANPNKNWIKFNVVAGGNHTNITGISIINGDLFIQGASYVTVDDIFMNASMSGVGSGTGFLSIHSNAYYTTVKNSFFENGGTGSSCVVLGKGGKYATFDNNVFEITGSSGNVLSSNVFVGAGELPQAVNYTNNVINSHVAGSGFMYGITVCGEGNIIENNTLNNFKGNAIINQYGATSTKNIYRNNTITGGGSMAVGTYSLVEGNHLDDSPMTVTEGCTFIDNTVKSLTISGKNVEAMLNNVLTTVTINAAATNTTFALNNVGGLVTVNSNGNKIVANIINTTSEYTVDLKSTENNTVTANVLYAAELVGDASVNYENENNTVENNYPMDVELTVNVENITVGEDAVVNITFTQPVTGSVEVIVNGKKYNAHVVAGKALFNVSDLPAGRYTVGVYFDGNLLYHEAEALADFTVDKFEADMKVDCPFEATVGDNINITVTVANATGTIGLYFDDNFIDAGVLDKNSTLTFGVRDLIAGDHYFTVTYLGDDKFDKAFMNLPISVAKETSEANITVPSDVKAGESAAVEVAIPGATGNVTVIVDGVESVVPLDENGTASVLIPAAEAGDHSVVVVYPGDDTHDAVVDTASFSVAKETSEANITVPSDVKAGESAAVEVAIPGATGNVTVFIDGVESVVPLDENGTASVSIPAAEAGDHSVVVVYPGDDTHDAAVATGSFSVEKVPSEANITIPTDFKVGEEANVTVDIPGATGNVSVIVNGIETVVPLDENGSAVVPIYVTDGENSVVVVYSGDETHSPVVKTATFAAVVVTTKFDNVTVASDLNITAILIDGMGDGIANATITYTIGNVTNSIITSANGQFTIPGVAGETVTIDYAGDDVKLPTSLTLTLSDIAPEFVEANFNITGGLLILNGYAVDTKAGENGIPYATELLDSNGKPIVGVPIKFALNDKVYNRTTNENGSFDPYHLNMKKAQKYTIAFYFAGDDNYTSAFASVCANLAKKPITIKASAKSYKAKAKTKSYTVTLSTIVGSSDDGKVHLSPKKVSLTVNGKTYTAKTNNNGKVTFKLTNLSKKGVYTAKISYAGDDTYESASKSVKITIK